ncbi:MAG TPA: L,D-transpeptidase family protein [Rhizomicrobium sp.]
MAILFAHHPDLARQAKAADAFFAARAMDAAAALDSAVVKPGERLASAETQTWVREARSAWEARMGHADTSLPADPAIRTAVRSHRHAIMRATARADRDEPGFRFTPPVRSPVRWTPRLALENPSLASLPVPASQPASPGKPARQARRVTIASPDRTAAALPRLAPLPDIATADRPPPGAAEITRVAERLKDNLTSEMLDNFGLFLYISKAASGPWAQRMYVFKKQDDGNLALLYNWPVSTGRERVEYNAAGLRLPSFTPAGYYELDPDRLYRHYHSHQWGEPMPYAMFFNWIKNGNQTGLAIHSATRADVAMLGQRASAGCVRLPPAAARTLFTLIRSDYRGLAPRFAIDRRTGTMSNDGILLHDADGHARLADGYKVLVFIENYGGDNVVAALF